MSGRSHIGLVRKSNEDEFAFDETLGYIIVADGIGGHQNGHIASRLAVETAKNHIIDHMDEPPQQLLQEAFTLANQVVHDFQEEHVQGHLMGTTMTLVLLRGEQFFFGHIGDSRAYLLRTGRLPLQVTQDHTYLAELAQHDTESMKNIEADRIIDKKNTLVRAIGPDRICQPQFGDGVLVPDDVLFLVTDGMYRYVTPQEMAEIISYTDDLDDVAQRFEQLALERGGKDNLTIVLYKRGKVNRHA